MIPLQGSGFGMGSVGVPGGQGNRDDGRFESDWDVVSPEYFETVGMPIVEGRAKTVATAIEELTPYLMGKDPRPVAHHWQAMYRHAFYRGGPILTSAISGVDQALWDIKGKALGVPVYELLGGPTRTRVRVYAHATTV